MKDYIQGFSGFFIWRKGGVLFIKKSREQHSINKRQV